MSYQQMSYGGKLWIEQRSYVDARDEIARAQGCADAQAMEIKHLREIAGSVSILAGKIQEMDAGLQLAREKREKPALQIGWYAPVSRRFCYTDEKECSPERKADYTVPVYVIAP